MENRVIIGICGQIGAGKDTLANAIARKYPTFKVVHFADKLKEVVSCLIGEDIAMSQYGKSRIVPGFGFSQREMLQYIGTDLFRNNFDPNIWVKALEKANPTGNLVIADVRFANEIDWIRDNGGLIVTIHRSDNPYEQSNHSSEGLNHNEEADKIVFNNGMVSDLEKEVDYVVDAAMKKIESSIPTPKNNILSIDEDAPDAIDIVHEWMTEFKVLEYQDGDQDWTFNNDTFKLYMKLIAEEFKELTVEVEQDNPDIRDIALEAADLIWVTIGAALSVVPVETLKTALRAIFESNMSKATTDLLSALEYSKEINAEVHNTVSGKFFVKDSRNKIRKGPHFKKVYIKH